MKKIKHIMAEKIVSDPIKGIIDIRPILPLIKHNRHFESLNYKYQLGMSYLVFPSATHTRAAHSFGSYEGTVKSTQLLENFGMINKKEATSLCAFALLHDIGHFPFSHVSETLAPIDHEEYGVKIIKKMKDRIEACDIDFNFFISLFEHKNPLHLIVSDKNLGTEKLDYLERDGLCTILSRPPGIQYLQRHIYFIENNLVIDEKAIDNARDIQDFYIKMYKGVYLRKAAVIAQRMMQKIIYLAILAGELTPNELTNLSDFQLLSIFNRSKNDDIQYLYNLLMERRLFREAVVLRYGNFMSAGKVGDKHIGIFGLENEIMDKLSKNPNLNEKNQKSLLKLEGEIAKILKIKSRDVLVVPLINPYKFKTKDIKILTSGGKISSLKKEYPAHFLDMEETGKAYAALRICIQEQYREKVAKMKNELKKLIFSFCGLL